jgi:hypothetical protein
VLHQVFYTAFEIAAQFVNGFRAGAVPALIQDLRQGHAIQARGACDLSDGDSPSLQELALFDHLAKLESDHSTPSED